MPDSWEGLAYPHAKPAINHDILGILFSMLQCDVCDSLPSFFRDEWPRQTMHCSDLPKFGCLWLQANEHSCGPVTGPRDSWRSNVRKIILLLSAICLLIAPAPLKASSPEGSPLYLLPAPGAANVSPATSLALRQGDPFDHLPDEDAFTVTGSRGGYYSGEMRLSDDRLTLLFYPEKPFAFDETVTVAIRPGLKTAAGIAIPATTYQFYTLQRPLERVVLPSEDGEIAATYSITETASPYVTHPEFTSVMPITVTSPAQNTGDGFLFMTGLTYQAMMMVDNTGEPYFIKQVPEGYAVTDFKRQIVQSTPYLSYHEGISSNAGWSNGVYHVMDQSYNVVDTWTIGNGYGADLHDFQMLDNGHALMISYTPIPYDLRPYGGPKNGIVIDAVLQEQDSGKNVVFEWHASQHLPITDSYDDLSNSPVDYVHTNAIDVDLDGNLLVSNRNTSSVVKVNRQTGNVIWILGGRRNQFVFTNDLRFSRQHDIRRLANGNITLFDNGNDKFPPRSRAVEYEMNEAARRVTRVWQYPEGDSYFAPFMGNVQRLGNGNTVIGWGAVPGVTEVRPDNSKGIELELGGSPYRVFRFPWDGVPAESPRAAVVGNGTLGQVTVYASWNGATDVDAYEVYAGPTSQEMSMITTVPRSGFETSVALAGLSDDTCAFQVRPVNHDGQPAPYSNVAWRVEHPACQSLLNWSYLPLIVK